MKNIFKRAACLLMTLMLAMSMSVVALAVDGEEGDGTSAPSGESSKSDTVKSFIQSNITSEDGQLTFKVANLRTLVYVDSKGNDEQAVTLSDGETIVYYGTSSENAIYQLAQKTQQSNQISGKVNDMTGGFKVEADVGGAAVMLSGFQPLIALIVGLICYIVVIGMGLFTALDICYIAFPVFRNKCEDAKTNGNGMMTKKTSGGDTELRWITDDAQYAVTQCTVDSGRSPWGMYLKKRILTYILLAIILYILMTGNIDLFVNIALKFVSGIMDALSGLAA